MASTPGSLRLGFLLAVAAVAALLLASSDRGKGRANFDALRRSDGGGQRWGLQRRMTPRTREEVLLRKEQKKEERRKKRQEEEEKEKEILLMKEALLNKWETWEAELDDWDTWAADKDEHSTDSVELDDDGPS